jgi:hypothetical protein
MSRFSQWTARGSGLQDALLAILPATRAGSGPALPVVCNMLDRDDGREANGRGLCRRDHARRRSPAHDKYLRPPICYVAARDVLLCSSFLT